MHKILKNVIAPPTVKSEVVQITASGTAQRLPDVDCSMVRVVNNNETPDNIIAVGLENVDATGTPIVGVVLLQYDSITVPVAKTAREVYIDGTDDDIKVYIEYLNT